nr:hypothetical protein [Tanacetum cinerariifolium]
MRRLCHCLIAHTLAGRGQAPEKVASTDLHILRSMDQEAVNLSYLLAHYLFRHAEGRKRGAQMSRGHFITCLADHFVLLTEERMHGLTTVGPKRQQVVAANAPKVAEGAAHAKEEGNQAILAPVQVLQLRATARTMPQRLARLEEEVHGIQVSVGEQCEVVDAIAKDLSRFTVWAAGFSLYLTLLFLCFHSCNGYGA